jgi:YbbR domain-containing protein
MDIFKNPATKIPMNDPMVVRVDMEELQIGGRKSHLPAKHVENDLSISHVPSTSNGTS